MIEILFLALWSQCVAAGVISAPAALITPAPVFKRGETIAGYQSTGESDGTILWDTITYDADGSMVATSSDLFRICPISECIFFACNGDYLEYTTSGVFTSEYCGSSDSMTCSYNLLFSDVSDTAPMTNYWCDDSTVTGFDIYEVTPTDGAISTPESTPTSTPTSTPDPSSTPTTPGPVRTDPPALPTAKPEKKSVPIGAIVGGVVGGIAVIGIIIVAVIILLRRKKQSASAHGASAPGAAAYGAAAPGASAPGAQPVYYQSPPMNQTYPVAGAAPLPEKTATVTTAYPNYGEAAMSPPMSPAPQYSPNNGAINELPTQRM